MLLGNKRTKDDDVEDENDKPQQSAASAVLPGVVQRFGRDGSSEAEGGQAELEHDAREERVESHGGWFLYWFCGVSISERWGKLFWRLRNRLGNVER